MKFLATCACEKVIIDKHGVHSLITVMANMDIALEISPGPDAPKEVPPNLVIPKDWFIFSMWLPSAEEIGKNFVQVIEIYWPNGDKFAEARLKFKTDEKAQYNSLCMQGFPAGQVGNVKVITWIESEDHRITEVFDYYLAIKRVSQQEALARITAPMTQ